MKVLISSNANFVQSGYGVQTDLMCRALIADGHQVVVAGFYGHHGPPMNIGGVITLASTFAEWNNDSLKAHVAYEKPDVTVILADAWIVNPDVMEEIRPVFWAPVDHKPVPPLVQEHLFSARHVWSMSRFGHEELLKAGLRPTYVPHGVDTEAYTPVDRLKARREWGIPDDAFMAMCVGANRGWPSRKSLDRILKAWGAFVHVHPDAVLYLHALPNEASGIDLEKVAKFYSIPQKNLRFPDVYRMARNEYHAHVMNGLYNAADVFVLPSAGEGFGVPVIEAQAAGCPVIVADATAQTELCGAGWLVEVDQMDDMAITLQYSEQANIRPSKILECLIKAHAAKGDTALREKARAFGLTYDYRRVWTDYMRPAFQAAVADKVEREARRTARIAPLTLEDEKYLNQNGVQIGNPVELEKESASD